MPRRTLILKTYVSESLYQTAHWQAHREHLTLSAFLTIALREALEHRNVDVRSMLERYQDLYEAPLAGQRLMEGFEDAGDDF
jgi:hypothetical protein